ncbi:DUF5938 domain-containing protein [Conexibacter sp. SYSU D00693]|uniref:DUF5938 domain-containing protein n=1 Tax=Conexibacter sp. SYSU D00693 TaxID=2812560 RepID=UPI00196B3145|nr:DUF5938 domain-containing protein [Conexibacter sp. SYSU D00693]
MSKPVVVYGASGYTGRLVCEYLREYRVPFIAAGRNEEKLQKAMASLPGVETADYEVRQVDHTVDALSELFDGASVVLNMVGPFIKYGDEVVQACSNAGAHYLDTTGEQVWVRHCDEVHGADFAEKGLLLSPGIAQMYTTGEIAANIALETPGLDTLDILVLWKGFPTIASTATIFATLTAPRYYLEHDEYVPWAPGFTAEAVVPFQHQTTLALDWSGTSHPVWFKHDPRVSSCKAMGGLYDRALMEGVVQTAGEVGAKAAEMTPEQAEEFLLKTAAEIQSDDPPRENTRINISMESVHASGPSGVVSVTLRGINNYKQTGLLQAYGAFACLRPGALKKTGFASGCQAFGHRELLGQLKAFGLVNEPRVVGDTW